MGTDGREPLTEGHHKGTKNASEHKDGASPSGLLIGREDKAETGYGCLTGAEPTV